MKGSEDIAVSINNPSDDLILDWRVVNVNGKPQQRFSDLKVNGEAATDARRANDHIFIPSRYLKEGENRIELSFQSPVSTSGSAVTRYLDREDGSEYIYTLFVPSDASTTFPCFDQPDLKARFRLSLSVDRAWRAVSNTLPDGKPGEVGATGLQRWQFAETRPISTYLFAFAAGPFEVISDKKSTHHTRIFVRRSRLERARKEAPEVFRITREGLEYFTNYFGFPYPFPKYDLVLIPNSPTEGWSTPARLS